MKTIFHRIFISIALFFLAQTTYSQNAENWTANQLMQPADLASAIRNEKDVPLIFNVGPAATIPNSVDMGMGKEKTNIDKFKNKLDSLSRDKKIVIYCGCCPFDHCPNVRPAIDALKELKFTNYYLLNIPHNIKTDWIDKGYPSVKP